MAKPKRKSVWSRIYDWVDGIAFFGLILSILGFVYKSFAFLFRWLRWFD